jgi:hypothetical protein
MAFTLTGDYYVDAINGSDSNPGTRAEPFATIPAAVAAAEAGGSGYQDIIVGAGVYTERIVAGTTTDYLCLKADGLVIFDASSQTDSAFYNGQLWEIKGFTIINAVCLLKNSNDSYVPKFTNCFLKNITDWYLGTTLIEQGLYYVTNCIIENCRSLNSAAFYTRYWNFQNCLFIDSSAPGQTLNGNDISSNSYPARYSKCAFYGTSSTAWDRNNNGGEWNDCVVDYRKDVNDSTEHGRVSGSALEALFLTSSAQYDYINCRVVSMSLNDNLSSGSDNASDARYTIPGVLSNKSFITDFSFNPAGRFSKNSGLATAYGHDSSSTNPFHPMGGATFTNITSSTIHSGFQISSSSVMSGSIESAVIDQGSSKVVDQVKTGFQQTLDNQIGFSVYSASALNQLPTRQTFEMRYGNAADLSSTPYKIFDLFNPLRVDLKGSGSGDVNFSTTSSEHRKITARYLQFKFTLRTNLTGSV